MQGRVISVALSGRHGFSKAPVSAIHCLTGLGIEGDAHCGVTVKHRSRVAVDPGQPNLRQVHLLHFELLTEVNAKGFDVAPGALGENITTAGLNLLEYPLGTVLWFEGGARLRLTGLRNPCAQIDAFRPGLLREMVIRGDAGQIVRRAGVMAVVEQGGIIGVGNGITAILPDRPHLRLERV